VCKARNCIPFYFVTHSAYLCSCYVVKSCRMKSFKRNWWISIWVKIEFVLQTLSAEPAKTNFIEIHRLIFDMRTDGYTHFFTQPPIQWVPGAISLGVKRPAREADHSAPSGAEVEECVEMCLHSPNTPSWRGAQFKKTQGQLYLYLLPIMLLSYELCASEMTNGGLLQTR
jgi:hypothetical protein